MQRPGETFCRGDSMCKGPEEAMGSVSRRLVRLKTGSGGESGRAEVGMMSMARLGWGP